MYLPPFLERFSRHTVSGCASYSHFKADFKRHFPAKAFADLPVWLGALTSTHAVLFLNILF